MLHEPCRTVGRQSTLLHAVQHGGVSCMGITNPPLALSGHARQFRAETLCSAKRGKGKGVRGALPHGGWDRVLDFVLTHVLIALTMSAARSWGRHHTFKKWRQQGGGQVGGGRTPDCVLLHVLIRQSKREAGYLSSWTHLEQQNALQE